MADILVQGRIDAVIADLILREYDLICVLERLKKVGTRLPGIFALSGFTSPALEKRAESAGVYYYMLKPVDAGSLAERVADYLNLSLPGVIVTELEKQIMHELMLLGIPPHIKGFEYIKCGIMLLLREPGLMRPITEGLYRRIAERYNTTISGVERAIRTSIEIAYNKSNNQEALESCFGGESRFCRKATNSEFLSALSGMYRAYGSIFECDFEPPSQVSGKN